MIFKVAGYSIQKVESEFTKIIDSDVGRNEKLKQLFSLMAKCWLPDQGLFNPDSNWRSMDIANAITVALNSMNYNEVVNMQDVTGLDLS